MANDSSKVPNFGFDGRDSTYHFAVVVDSNDVRVEERFTTGEATQQLSPQVRAVMDTYRWGRVAEAVQSHFNRRLQDSKKKTAKWALGEHLLAPYLGKELTLLAWASEDVDPTDLPNVLANWLGLAPEERWWLYGMAKASSGNAEPPSSVRGWRKAIRIAFSESSAPGAADYRHAVEEVAVPRIAVDEARVPPKMGIAGSTGWLFGEDK